jgi:hypothetical protein
MFLVMQVDDVVECCKCICSALCAVVQACYGPCATANSSTDLVYGMPVVDAVLEGSDVLVNIEHLQER